MAEIEAARTVWEGLETWGKGLKAWQSHVLALATEYGTLSEEQVAGAYDLFLQEVGLAAIREQATAAATSPGRPAEALAAPLRLDRIDGLRSVNALPDGSVLDFGPNLTVIYGRNGAGKSGFGRLFANACFSRSKPQILANIYSGKLFLSASATFHFAIGGQAQAPHTLKTAQGTDHPELRRISVFDAAAAQHRVTQSAPFEFKPSGFDVFPEMARAYGELSKRLDADIKDRTHQRNFSESFIGAETAISKSVAGLGPSTDLEPTRRLAVYGDTERARLEAVDRQLVALKSNSPAVLIAQLQQAKGDIAALAAKLAAASTVLSAPEATRRATISRKARETADAAALLGAETFTRPFFKAVGTPEWQAFAKATHALAHRESTSYPEASDHCLLCERSFDEASRRHVEALLQFVRGDAQREAELAAAALQTELTHLRDYNLAIFDEESRARDHLNRLDPALASTVAAILASLAATRDQVIAALQGYTAPGSSADMSTASGQLAELGRRIDADIGGLEARDSAAAIAALELEHQTLRHREVLTQLLPSIETFVTDVAWCSAALRAKSALNPKAITDTEKELFAEIIGKSYRARLAEECGALDCTLPIELQTVGQKGQTMRSLAMKGGHRPDAILSEGEQKAIALADFMTEIGLNPASAGIVLDDPVTSQDHERKERIAARLVKEAHDRQVIVFTHDLPFLNMLLVGAENASIDTRTHWIDRAADGSPGLIALNDAPATSKHYDTTGKAKQFLAEAKGLTGTARDTTIRNGMSALRRTIEEAVVKRLLKGVVPRWSDRVIVTGLKNIAWNESLADDFITAYEELSRWIEAHSHTDEASGAPPDIKNLESKVDVVDGLLTRCRKQREK